MFGVRKNPKIRPQIRTFGQGLPRDFQKRQLFAFLQCSHPNPSCESKASAFVPFILPAPHHAEFLDFSSLVRRPLALNRFITEYFPLVATIPTIFSKVPTNLPSPD